MKDVLVQSDKELYQINKMSFRGNNHTILTVRKVRSPKSRKISKTVNDYELDRLYRSRIIVEFADNTKEGIAHRYETEDGTLVLSTDSHTRNRSAS